MHNDKEVVHPRDRLSSDCRPNMLEIGDLFRQLIVLEIFSLPIYILL